MLAIVFEWRGPGLDQVEMIIVPFLIVRLMLTVPFRIVRLMLIFPFVIVRLMIILPFLIIRSRLSVVVKGRRRQKHRQRFYGLIGYTTCQICGAVVGAIPLNTS